MIIYRPYKSHVWPLPFTVSIGALAFVAAGYCMPYWGYNVLIWVTVGIACAWLTKVLYVSANSAVIFEQDSLRIIGGRYNDYRCIPWEQLPYAYYIRSFKGHLFVVLSPKALSHKETKSFANRGANSSRICIDYVVVIYLDILQNISQLKELIDNHVLYIYSH